MVDERVVVTALLRRVSRLRTAAERRAHLRQRLLDRAARRYLRQRRRLLEALAPPALYVAPPPLGLGLRRRPRRKLAALGVLAHACARRLRSRPPAAALVRPLQRLEEVDQVRLERLAHRRRLVFTLKKV